MQVAFWHVKMNSEQMKNILVLFEVIEDIFKMRVAAI